MAMEHPLTIDIPNSEYYDDEKEEFFYTEAKTVVLEHSLYSISKWETNWHKCFVKNVSKLTVEQSIDYIKCMDITNKATREDIMWIINNKDVYKKVQNYMRDSMTATYIRETPGRMPDSEAKTSELFYYYLVKLRMPVEIFEHWHFNRLTVLLSVFSMKDDMKHKRSVREIMVDNDKLNEERKKALKTKG